MTGVETQESVEILRSKTGAQCEPSPESVEALATSDLVLVSGMFIGAGKSMVIDSLVREGYQNIASWTNRKLRRSEVEGVDKCHRSLEVMAERAVAGFFLELEEVRPGMFYATPAEFGTDRRYVKDLELRGAMRLRTMAPEIPIIIPLPPLKPSPKQVTEWEKRVVEREQYHRALGDDTIYDLETRLEGAIDEAGRVHAAHLLDDPYTLFVVNDSQDTTIETVQAFLQSGTHLPDADIESHIEDMVIHIAEAVIED